MENGSDLAGHLARIEERRRSLRAQLAEILRPGDRFVWEIGAGHGHFLTAFADAHRELPCIGVDLRLERVERARRKRDRAGLPHLHFLRGDAGLFLEALPAGARVAAIFVLFPDPWPKLRHHKHRLLQPHFLHAIAARAEPGAPLCFRTDYEPYFRDVEAVLGAHADWKVTDEPWPFELATLFQQRAARFHSLLARKRTPPGPALSNRIDATKG